MKHISLYCFLLISLPSFSQSSKGADEFWENLLMHCGKAYAGDVIEAPANDDFRGKSLRMYVISCTENEIRIPFYVGDDRSRTWVLSKQDGVIQLKHDHRHEDGSEDEITQYGGIAPNTGLAGIQFFPADQETSDLIPYASNNVWWITLDEDTFTYNLRRIGSDRFFSVAFNLKQTVDSPAPPWGWGKKDTWQ
ncbi:hypothetical protein [Pararhodonellum marinum]|uniref:hypothetical protein n=1 Tax=Pararhodonellum marinum TaxID=2755358 RepID=UPI00188FFEC0|nr:hypothetical protein [Pararhodonellum marinum]